MKLDKKQWEDWQESPVTEYLLHSLRESVDKIKESAQHDSLVLVVTGQGDPRQIQYASGVAEGYTSIIKMIETGDYDE